MRAIPKIYFFKKSVFHFKSKCHSTIERKEKRRSLGKIIKSFDMAFNNKVYKKQTCTCISKQKERNPMALVAKRKRNQTCQSIPKRKRLRRVILIQEVKKFGVSFNKNKVKEYDMLFHGEKNNNNPHAIVQCTCHSSTKVNILFPCVTTQSHYKFKIS